MSCGFTGGPTYHGLFSVYIDSLPKSFETYNLIKQFDSNCEGISVIKGYFTNCYNSGRSLCIGKDLNYYEYNDCKTNISVKHIKIATFENCYENKILLSCGYSCFGYGPQETKVCNSNGICMENGTCNCTRGEGIDCINNNIIQFFIFKNK